MKVIITGFRCYDQGEFEFPNSEITLVSGNSGSGKTTIFEAIRWCLYGRLRNVYPKSGSSNCQVQVTIPVSSSTNFTITRQKKPDRITVQSDGPDGSSTWTDTVAQDMIIQTFGDEKLWLSTSYIKQKDRCLILSGTQKEKLQVLRTIALGDDDPDEYINTITNKAKELETSIVAQRAVYERQVLTYNNQIASKSISQESTAAIPKLSEYVTWKTNSELKLKQLHQKLLKYQNDKGQLDQLRTILKMNTDKLSVITKDLPKEEPPSSEQINGLQQQILTVRQQLQLKRQLNELLAHRSSLKLDDKFDAVKLSSLSQFDIRMQNSKHIQGLQICNTYGCEYTIESIAGELKNLQDKLKLAEKAQQYRRTQARIDQLKKNLGPLPDVKLEKPTINEDITDTEVKLNRAKLSQELLCCPNCSAALKLVVGKLVKVEDVSPGMTDADIKALNFRIQQLRNYQLLSANNSKNLSAIAELEKLYPEPIISTDNPIALKSAIASLQSVSVVPKPEFTDNDIKVATEIVTVDRKIELLKSQISTDISTEPVDNLQAKLVNMQTSRDKYLRLTAEINRLNSELSSLYQRESTLVELTSVDPQNDYNNLKSELDRLTSFIGDIEYAKDCTEQLSKLNTDKQSLQQLYARLNSLNNLKTTAIKVEYQQLNDTVNVINTVLEEILAELFEEPIQVVLSMFKILKTGGRVKPKVNLHIMYKGSEYDSVSDLSGGEGDRVSLAIIIALGIVSNSKLLLLDECLSSIGGELREAAIEMIRKYNSRTVLIIDHEAVEGIYDKTLKVFS